MKEKKTSKKIEEAAEKASVAAAEFGKKAEKVGKAAAKKFDEVSDKVADMAEDLGDKFEEGAEKTKKAATWVKKWWLKSSTEEKITTILWIILLICALWELKKIIWGVLLLLFWILCVTGYFDGYLEDLFEKFGSDKKASKKK